MIARGSRDESEAQRHIQMWSALLLSWNEDADRFREAARGNLPVTPDTIIDAGRARDTIRDALDLADTLADNLAPGHELRADLFRLSSAMESLSDSIGRSVERLQPRTRTLEENARLRYLVAELRRDAGQAG